MVPGAPMPYGLSDDNSVVTTTGTSQPKVKECIVVEDKTYCEVSPHNGDAELTLTGVALIVVLVVACAFVLLSGLLSSMYDNPTYDITKDPKWQQHMKDYVNKFSNKGK
jgi:hypothetical protein